MDDQTAIFNQARGVRRWIAGLRRQGDRTDFRPAETQRRIHRRLPAVRIKTGRQTDRIFKLQTADRRFQRRMGKTKELPR